MNGKFGGGNGTSTNPFLIEDADDLNVVRNFPSSYFKLTNDINLGNSKYNTDMGWNPIRNFRGFIEGNNHKIINLYINRPAENFVGFFRDFYGNIQNVTFVDADIKGNKYVGCLCGYVLSDYVHYPNRTISDIYVIGGKISGNASVCGLIGIISNLSNPNTTNTLNIKHCFIETKIYSQEDIVYGITRSGYGIVGTRNCNCPWNDAYTHNCNCNCDAISWNGLVSVCGKGEGGYNLPTTFYNVNYIDNIIILHKTSSTATYYAISSSYAVYTNNYVDNYEFAPIVASGINYANLSSVPYSRNIFPNMNKKNLQIESNKKVKIATLNKDCIYFKTNRGYEIYDFNEKEFVLKYIRFNNENSKKIINDGMTMEELRKIPSKKIQELYEQNDKLKIINCINAHEKIVSKSEIVEVNNFEEYLDKKIFRNKIKFDKHNDKIMNVTRI